MRRSFTVLLLSLLIHQTTAQFVDDFTDGDLSSNPTWEGMTDRFVVTSGEMQLFAPEITDESYLVVPSAGLDNGIWEFYVRMEFGTSGSNYSRVYLMSTAENLLGSLNGYFVLIGQTADEISLYRQDGTSTSVLIDGIDKSIDVNPVEVRIRVTRNASGGWELFQDLTGGTSFTSAGSATDNTYCITNYFGVRCTYTSTRHDLFFFDDFLVTGTPITDTEPPTITGIVTISNTQLDVSFSENLEEATAENSSNYSIDGGINVVSANLDTNNKALVHLTTSSLTNGTTQTLTVSGVKDEAGNVVVSEQAQFQYLVFSEASFRNVQINEFLSDPGDESGLPNADFVELFNNTENYFNLEGWNLLDAVASSSNFPSYTLAPGEFVIVCDEDFVPDFELFGDVIGLSSFPAFNNIDDQIALIDDLDVTIDQVVYGDVANEGISNEQVNPDLICSGDFNFKPSEAANGGTPGAENSVLMILQDGFAPELVGGRALSEDSIRLDFDEFLNASSVDLEDFSISPTTAVIKMYLLNDYPETVFLKLAELIAENTVYTATAIGLSDCSGNSSSGTSIDFLLGISPKDDDILLSEVLFNPVSGAFDFVEIYNPSSTENFELRGWKLARLVDGEIDDPTHIAEDGLILKPGGFLFFSEEIPATNNYIRTNTYVELSVPSYNDDEGTVLLLNANDEIVQQFDYLDDYHYDLLEDEEGVSLERVSYTAPVNDPNNWRSAASTVGFQTPGNVNSQSITQTENQGQLIIEPKVFIPGNTGSGRDFTTINYQFNQGGQFANVMVYDQSGRPVKQLVNGASLSTTGFIRWDGETDRGGMAQMGYYVVVFEVYNGNGKSKTLKETVVVGRDF